MHKNSTMLTASLVAMAFALWAIPAKAADEGGGADATDANMPAICNGQAETLKLTGAERATYMKRCTVSAVRAAASRSARKLEGTKDLQ